MARVLDIRATQLVEAVVEPAHRLITPRTANPRALTGGRWGNASTSPTGSPLRRSGSWKASAASPAAVFIDPLNVRSDYPPSSLGMKKTSQPGRIGWK